MPVTLMIPRALLKGDGTLWGRSTPIVAADIDDASGGRISVNGRPDWMLAGLPSLLELSIEKVRQEKDHAEIELRGRGVVVKLRFADSVDEPEAALGRLLVEGRPDTPEAERYQHETYAALARTFFTGELSTLPEERKRAILTALQSAPGAPDVHLHDGRLHASFDLGRNDLVYNDRDYEVAEIVAYVLNETVLGAVRERSTSLPDVPELRGIRFVHHIPHKSEERAEQTADYQLEIVASAEALGRFARGEITNQALVDRSLLLVDGSPLRIDLTD